MKNLNIHTGNESVSINLAGNDLSITINNPSAAPANGHSIQPALEWSETLLDGEAVTYGQAERAVEKLEGDGWRLPTRRELESLLDLSRHDPAIDTEKYPDTKSCYYWTCTPCAGSSAAVWVVDFGYGSVYDNPRNLYACVRAVRSCW